VTAWTGGRARYGYGGAYEYRSSITIAGWPLVHICGGIDPETMKPKLARGIIAIGNIAVGVLAIGGVACGLFAVGGASIGLLLAVGGAAIGAGVSIGGVAVGTVAIGGLVIGFSHAVGGVVIAPQSIAAALTKRDVGPRAWL
jgi:hypothetical protein